MMSSLHTPPAPQNSPADDARYSALLARRADVDFVYGVTSTGICCRADCSSRRPLRQNTRFFASYSVAEAAGFRACRRCRPDAEDPKAEQARLIGRICRTIDEAESPPSLATLAAQAAMSVYHFHRVFRAVVGVTPKAYAAQRRRQRLQRALPGATSVTDAAYDAGYTSSTRFYANAAAELGMSPTAYRAGGAQRAIRFSIGSCSLGAILVAATDRGVCALDIGDDAATLVTNLNARFPAATIATDDASLDLYLARAIALVDDAPSERSELALDIVGTAFAQRVWAALRTIPFGRTATYREIAEAIGAPGSARAVAKACASNPIALAIPCHRVVREDGAETAYRWGASRKRELLRRERGD